MKIALMTVSILASFSSVWADGARVKVNGMVCSFCSTSIEKKFKEKSEVSAVKVDLDNKLVAVDYHPGKELSDEQIKDIITKSGYTVASIEKVGSDNIKDQKPAPANANLKKKQ